MRSARLVHFMLMLQHGSSATAQELADSAGVSVRTVYRDIAALSEAGVPLWTESGPGGGIRLLDGWQSKLTGMTGLETSALMLLGVPSIAADLGLADASAAAENKLLGALPMPLREGARLWRERLHVDTPGWFAAPTSHEHLKVISAAVLAGRKLLLEYRGNTRVVDPLGLVAKASVWYLVAGRDGTVLSYRVDRVDGARMLAEPAVRPAGFVLPEWWSRSMKAFDRALLTFDCRVRLSPRALRMLPAVIGPEATPGVQPSEEWTTVDLRLETEEVALGQLTALGSDVEVLSPLSLRHAMRDVAMNMVGLHT